MNRYKALFFDIDDTLLDFRMAESDALRLLLMEQQMLYTQQAEAHYKMINQNLWKSFEKGEISRNEVINTRFSTFFKEYGRVVDGVALEKTYRSYLEQGHQEVNGAHELVAILELHHDLYIVSNGVSRTQDKRLRDSGLDVYFKQVFISEDTGYQKPMKEFFDYVFACIPDFKPEQGLIIGDSLSADIRGGQLAGMDTCWFNPERKQNETGIEPTYEIQQLSDLYSIINKARYLGNKS
ncbi:HAD family hydrolase [Peribacillus simplex]|uniref:YjjG family noncanonical pyrimidine nucleotidase n=1 Tax=Peribacillus simplex TaxID=1478 RepID=UPI000776DEC5|nr:YjjG family noncanonical pyrimidine nucleotidase [Peribacillus simplex]AMM95460.1 HAD family hydrolase [Peribacillus simplex]